MLRWAFVALPLAGGLLAAATGSWLWAWVERKAFPAVSWRGILSGPGAAVLLAFVALPLAWRLGIWWEQRRGPGRRQAPLAALLSVCVVLAAECALRLPFLHEPFWLAVLQRHGGAEDFFLREVALSRLQAQADRGSPPAPGVVVAGSSQLMRGIDYAALARALPGVEVRRRCIAGMIPFRMCAALPYLHVQPGDTVLLYVSEFDLTGLGNLSADWIRPNATWSGVRDVLDVLTPAEWRAEWRGLVDVKLASALELWSMRDCFRAFLPEKAVAVQPGPKAEDAAASQIRQYQRSEAADPYYEASLRAFERVLARLKERGADVLVVEGRVKASLHTDASRATRDRARRQLSEAALRHGARFVPETAQDLALDDGDWADYTHLNASGRAKFTPYVAALLKQAHRDVHE